MNKIALLGTASALLLAACGDETTTNVNEITGMLVVGAGEMTPDCTEDNTGELVYMTDSAAAFFCADGRWQSLKGEQGIQGEKGDKGDTGEQGIQGEKGDKGDGDVLNIPLMGGGLSRTGMSSIFLLNLLIGVVVDESKKQNITESINIVLAKSAIDGVNLLELKKNWEV